MSEKERKHRMSSIQENILVSLYLLTQKINEPISVRDLRKIQNNDRQQRGIAAIESSNFSVSCKTLKQRGYLHKYRDNATLRVAYRLTDTGLEEGKKRYFQMLEKIKDEDEK